MENNEALIGKKVYGFKFKSRNDKSLIFTYDMEKFIGEVGQIIRYSNRNDSYTVKFSEESWSTWSYPAEKIKKHLVEEEIPELPDGVLMEVSNDEDVWVKRYVIGKKNSLFIAWTMYEKEKISHEHTRSWKYIRPIKETKLTLTLEEVAKRLGVDKVVIKEE